MSFFDTLFIAFYGICGFALASYLSHRYGILYGVVGFIVGFAVAMLATRGVLHFVGRGGRADKGEARKPSDSGE